MQEYLNPKSMITPGVAGALVTFLVNGLALPFPALPGRYVALALSFAMGALVVTAVRMKVFERIVYWALNSLVIFVVGFGTNDLGRAATVDPLGGTPSALAFLVPAAYASADDPPAPAKDAPADKARSGAAESTGNAPEKLRQELQEERKENDALRRENEALRKGNEAQAAAKKSFFKKW